MENVQAEKNLAVGSAQEPSGSGARASRSASGGSVSHTRWWPCSTTDEACDFERLYLKASAERDRLKALNAELVAALDTPGVLRLIGEVRRQSREKEISLFNAAGFADKCVREQEAITKALDVISGWQS